MSDEIVHVASAPLHGGVLVTPEETTDDSGRPVRDQVRMPCGCWSGEVFRTSSIAVPTADGGVRTVSREQWSRNNTSCPVHAGAVVVTMTRLAAQQHGLAALPQESRDLLTNHAERILAEAAALDARLAPMLGEHAPNLVLALHKAGAAMEGDHAVDVDSDDLEALAAMKGPLQIADRNAEDDALFLASEDALVKVLPTERDALLMRVRAMAEVDPALVDHEEAIVDELLAERAKLRAAIAAREVEADVDEVAPVASEVVAFIGRNLGDAEDES